MADTTVAILGAEGMLGTDLADAARKNGFDVSPFDLPDFDITNPGRLAQAVRTASIVVNCAAFTDVDAAQTQTELAHRINAEAVRHLGSLAKSAGVYVLHISTDFVFDGTSPRPYAETDRPNPINVYGQTKLEGERLLADSGCDFCILRVQWTYGRAGNNFVKKLVARAQRDTHLTVVDDQVGSPTATAQIAGVICKLLPQRPTGLFHFAAAGYVSRFEMAEFVFQKLRKKVHLTPCKTADFAAPAARPLNSRFDCSKIQTLLGRPIEHWQGPLQRFLEQL